MTPSPITLRPYQVRDLQAVREAMRVHRAVLLVQPTGSGKGTLAAHITHSAAAKDKSILFLVNRRNLVHDFAKRLEKLGVEHGVIMANDKRRKPWCSTHIASIDTLQRREHVPHADLLIIDEARFSLSPKWMEVRAKYPNAKVLGLDATPVREGRRGLGDAFDFMVQGPSVEDLIARKFLVPSVVYAPSKPDVSHVKKTAGDFNEKALAAVVDRPKLVGDIVQHWKKLASDRKTVIFGVDQQHAQHIQQEFTGAGVDCAYVDCDTSDEERDKIWNDFDDGRLQAISSVGTISFGWDHPICSAVVMARPTCSLSVHMQQIGRGSRPYPGKESLLVLDHAGNTHRHGFYEDPRAWTLETGVDTKTADRIQSVTTCRHCYATFRPGPDACPYCQTLILKKSREIQVDEGQLEEMKRTAKQAAMAKHAAGVSVERKKQHFQELVRTGKERGYKDGWARVKFHQIYRSWPYDSWLASNAEDRGYSSPGWLASVGLLEDAARLRAEREGKSDGI